MGLKKISLDLEAAAELLKQSSTQVDAASAAETQAAAGAKAALPGTAAGRRLLDLGWVRTHVPIVEVADKLWMGRRGKSAICPFHPDCNPSLSFHRQRFRCHAASCGKRGNVLDLVVGVLGCDLRGALGWLVQEGYAIPTLDPEARHRWRGGRAGVGGVSIDAVAKTGLLGLLPRPAALILSTLSGLADPDSGQVEVSYSSLGRRVGIRNRTKLSASLKILRWLELVNWRPAAVPGGFRAPSVYQLSLDLTTCELSVEKLKQAALTVTGGVTVKNARSHPRGDSRFTLGKLSSHVFGKGKKKRSLGREVDPREKSPPAEKKARPGEEKEEAAPPARRQRRVRHPGFGRVLL